MEEVILFSEPLIYDINFQPVIDFIYPFGCVFFITQGVIIALLVVLIFAKGWDSRGK